MEKFNGFCWQMGLLQWLLKLSGLWPYHVKWRQPRIILFFLLFLSLMGPCLMHLFHLRHKEDPSWSIFIILYLFYYFYGLCFFHIKQSTLCEIFETINESWSHAKYLPIIYQKIMYSYGKKIRRIIFSMLAGMGTITFGFMLQPFIMSSMKNEGFPKELRLNAWFPFFINESPTFQIVYVVQCVATIQCLLIQVMFDGIIVFIVFHGCGQLTILCEAVKNYKGILRHRDTGGMPVEIIERSCSCAKCITNQYIYQDKFVKKVAGFFNSYNMLRLMMSTMNFCLMAYLIVQSRRAEDASNLIIQGSIMLAHSSSFYGDCWVGQQLLNKNEELVRAVHEVSWYKYERRSVYPLLILLLRNKRPMRLTCGLFFPMSYELYSRWLSTACSYFSVYNAIKTPSHQQ